MMKMNNSDHGIDNQCLKCGGTLCLTVKVEFLFDILDDGSITRHNGDHLKIDKNNIGIKCVDCKHSFVNKKLISDILSNISEFRF